jgi:signal transduction histidine kinase
MEMVKKFPFLNSSSPFPISNELQTVLQRIVDDVVAALGCVGAMVATLEMDNSLPVRAYAVDVAPTLLKTIEDKLGVSFIGPHSVAYLDDKKFKDNLSVRAVKTQNGGPDVVISNKLHDLFRPVVSRPLSEMAQRLTKINQVIAVPFFIHDEVVGNLFAASRAEFSEQDIKFLTAFGRQAATAIQTQRYLTEMRALERVILAMQSSITSETQVLQLVVDTVVQKLGYVGAMVATLEANNSLPVRAYAVGFDTTLLKSVEQQLGVSLIGPKSVAYLDDPRYADNLSIRAVKGMNGRPQRFVVSDYLYDLFRPVINKPLSDLAQKLTGIKQVMAVPFFLEDEVVGNLFVASRRPLFRGWEKEVLATFGQQAAVGIRNARLYRIAEERRQIAQLFGKMAFSAAANIHALRNYIGAPRTYLQLLEIKDQLSPDLLEELQETGAGALEHLNRAIEVLDNLHEPWEMKSDEPTDVNKCLIMGIRKAFPRLVLDMNQDIVETGENLTIYKKLANNLPSIRTSPDMLTEAFRIMTKNAIEAIKNSKKGCNLWVETHLLPAATIEIKMGDDGLGIKPEHINKIFELGWSTKKGQGMGFGLFWTKDYIEGLGGNISVQSIWQQGTRFTIQLPSSAVDANPTKMEH